MKRVIDVPFRTKRLVLLENGFDILLLDQDTTQAEAVHFIVTGHTGVSIRITAAGIIEIQDVLFRHGGIIKVMGLSVSDTA
jgi:hypothetical protein